MTGNPRSTPEGPRERDRSKPRVLTGTDAQLLAEYREAVRGELRGILAELRPAGEPGLFGPNVKRPPLAERVTLWGLADRLARNLAGLGDLDDAPAPVTAPVTTSRRRHLGAVGD